MEMLSDSISTPGRRDIILEDDDREERETKDLHTSNSDASDNSESESTTASKRPSGVNNISEV
jgi:hypothetical protein